MANIIKSLKGLENGSIQFNRINTSPDEYTNVHSILFNGDQEGFTITSDSSGGFIKLIDCVTIDWQSAQMPNTAQLLNMTNGISLNDTSQLIDIIERISAKLLSGGIPEPTEATIESLSAESTDIDIDYLTTFIPVITAKYTDGSSNIISNSLFDWEIGDNTIISQDTNGVVTGIKANDTAVTLIATLKEDTTKTITFNITVNQVNIENVSYSGISDYTVSSDYDGSSITLSNIVLTWQSETLTENTDYTIEYQNNSGNVVGNVEATIIFTAVDNGNYYGNCTKKFNILKLNAGLSWSSNSATVQIENEENEFPTLNNPNNLTVTYSSTNESIATIDSNGIITLISDGTTKINAEFSGTIVYNSLTVTYTLTVNAADEEIEYYWYCGTDVTEDENNNYTLPDINENNIIIEEYDESLNDGSGGYTNFSTDMGWRKCDYIVYQNKTYIYTPNSRRDENGWSTGILISTSLTPYYVCVPKDLGLTIKQGVSELSPTTTITKNNIKYDLYLYSLTGKNFTAEIF